MSAMPVVWCTDPNSQSKKPTAFALHGIQLQGNLSERQVLALRELVNAAAEGRLLIPTDGATVQLDCGISIGSAIVKDKQTVKANDEMVETKETARIESVVSTDDKRQEPQLCPGDDSCISIDRLFSANTFCSHLPPVRSVPDPPATTERLEPKYSDDIYHNPPPPNHYDELYAFLCCAKCISDPAVSRLHAIAGGNYRDRRTPIVNYRSKLSIDHVTYVTNRYLQKNASRHHHRKQARKVANTWSLKRLKLAIGSTSGKFVHQHHHCKEMRRREVESPLYAMVKKGTLHKALPVAETVVESPADNDTINECPVDEPSAEIMFVEPPSNNSSRKTSFDSSCTEHGSTDSGFIEMQNRLGANVTETTPEEHVDPIASDADNLDDEPSSLQFNVKQCLALKSKNRRKSYEEFKAIFKKPTTPVPQLQPSAKPVTMVKTTSIPAEKVKSRRKSYEEFKQLVKECDAALTEQRMQRKNSKRHCRKSSAPVNSTVESTHESPAATKDTNKCGTIYDILQRKISAPALCAANPQHPEAPVKRLSSRALYDKMLSYGTLYDIVQQKQEDGTYQKYDQYMTYGTIYEILQRKSEDYEVFQRKRALSDKCIKRGLARFATGTKYNTLNFGTIYDILQRKQAFLGECESPQVMPTSRFSVKKVSEDVLHETPDAPTVSTPKASPALAVPDCIESKPSKKPTRIRRFSNILSYTPRHSPLEAPRFSLENIPPPIAEVLDASAVDAQQELYSRVHRTTATEVVAPFESTKPTTNDRPRVHGRKFSLQPNQCQVPRSMMNQAFGGPSTVGKCDNSDSRQQVMPVNNKDSSATSANNNTASVERSMSITTRKALWRKDKSRRLSEFTRGEFLNEKA